MNRNFRLVQSADFKRVRRSGKSYAHPFIVLVVLPAEGERPRIGITAGKSVGKAVERNRAKRLVREAVRPLLTELQPGLKILLICRHSIITADIVELRTCLQELFARAKILKASNEF